MANYYFLITAFPPLTLGMTLELTFKDLRDLLTLNLSGQDLELVDELLRPLDLYNIQAFWLGMPLDDRSQIKVPELEEGLLVQEGFPSYIIEFLERYETTEERLRNFSSLYSSMYAEGLQERKGFLLKYFTFEREMRLVLTGLRAKTNGKNLVRELQFEDPTDPFVMEILSQKDMPDLTPPKEYEDLKNLFVSASPPRELNRALLEYRFQKIEEMEEPQDFGIDRVLAYVAKFLIVESLSSLNQEKGMKQLRSYE